jgi:5-methylthioribose kinase
MAAAITASLLTAESVPAYLDARATEIGVFFPGAELTCSAIVGGNVNFAFRVEEPSTGKTLFVKQVQRCNTKSGFKSIMLSVIQGV